jgi:mRNA interferase RelE/StbE
VIYKIEFAKAAEKQFAVLQKQDLKKIAKRIEKLASNPFPPDCKKLEGSDDIYRVRQGDYRILYSVFEKKLVVLVLKIGHRKEIYKK